MRLILQYIDEMKATKRICYTSLSCFRVHIVGSAKRKQIHPEARASMFEEKTYGKRKIKDFLATVAGFERMMALVRDISRCLSFSK